MILHAFDYEPTSRYWSNSQLEWWVGSLDFQAKASRNDGAMVNTGPDSQAVLVYREKAHIYIYTYIYIYHVPVSHVHCLPI